MSTGVQNPYEWRKVIVWVLTLFLVGLTTTRFPLSSGAGSFALSLFSGVVWAVIGGVIIAVWKNFKRSTSTISPSELQANDRGLFIAALVLAVFLTGKAIYFETYGALVDVAILVGLGFAVKAGFGPARWGFAIFAFVTPILVMANGGGNAVIWPIVFYYACRSLGGNLVSTAETGNKGEMSVKPASSISSVHSYDSIAITPLPRESNHQPTINLQPPVMPTNSESISPTPHASPMDEDAVYEVVANELESGQLDKGLWTRLFAEMDGDERKTKIAYIKQRAGKLMTAKRARLEEIERQRAEEISVAENKRFERERTERARALVAEHERFRKVRQKAEQHKSNPRLTIDEKTDLLRLTGGDFKWLNGSQCSATFLGEEKQFQTGKEFVDWFISEVIPFLLAAESKFGHPEAS